jgi:dipeptidyl aminopeptidase/acylaminoacyl peptidase
MKRTLLLVPALLLTLAASRALLHADPRKPAAPQPLKMADLLAWKHLRTTALSPDGQWFAYRLGPAEGDGELVLRKTLNGEEKRFATGEAKGFGDITFSDDSKWLAFTVQPPKQKKPAADGKKPEAKLVLLELATGNKQEFEKVRRHVFSPKGSGWLALHKGAAEAPAAPGMAGQGPTPAAEKSNRGDLILRELATGVDLNIGNVAEFAFDKPGKWLAVLIDASDQSGNGVQLRNLTAATQITLDSGKAFYKGLNWTEKGDALAVLKGIEDKKYESKLYSVVGFTDLDARSPRKTLYDPHADKTFPEGMAVSPNRPAAWTEDLGGITFGIHKLKKKEKSADKEKKPAKTDVAELSFQPDRKQPAPKGGAKSADDAKERPDVVIWHWKDPRLQSEQQTKAGADKNHSHVCIYRVTEKKFHRLADETMKDVVVLPKGHWAIGTDSRAYDLTGSLDGRRYQDFYVVDLRNGERKLALKKQRWSFTASPEGTHALYYDDGHYHSYEFATGKTFNLTAGAPTSFINTEDDHNVVKPPTPVVGWAKDGKSVLLSDNWDVWLFPVYGGKATNLTSDGKRDGIRYQRRIVLDPEEKGIDLDKAVYFAVLGEWTKKGGIAAVDVTKGEPFTRKLLWDDAAFNTLIKAKKADVFAYSRETFTAAPEYFASGPTLAEGRKMTDSAAQQKKYLWSKGSMLVNYTSAKGKKLQGALYLPSNYEDGKKYPTIVYIYEKLSQGLNRFSPPTASGFNPSVYTSNGYAVFTPDIVYQINDPGRSAVWCVLPALEAAIATGVVDRDRVGLHGHSWGGYLTSFLITQTDVFKAAIAGAPLTNLVSMYSSIYWNVGIANQPIFESSQGRFTHPYYDDLEAYTRNSPVYFAKNVKTPLLLLHNDRDGAVDWNQGIEYFNTLRRLGKPVVLLQYKGENHGLVKAPNQRDYSVRMREFFDHHLKGQPAPAWLRDGVSHLEHEEHIKERTKMLK